MMAAFLRSAVVAVCLLPSLTLAQTPTSVDPPATGRVSGRVVTADGAAPIQGAFVRLSTRGGAADMRTEVTDARGVYEFTGLRPDSYALSWDKTGYLVRGQAPTWMSGAPTVEIGAGQSRREPDLVLERWGVIAVHVTDDLGNPRARVDVRALTVSGAGQNRVLKRTVVAVTSAPNFTSTKEFETDDKGNVRIYGLPAGEYVVVASPRSVPLVDADRSDHDLIFPPVYYPGVVSVAGAQTVSLRAGGERALNLALVPARTADISGRVLRSDGLPGRGFVIVRWNPAGVLYPANLIGDVLYRAELVDGRFVFHSLPPGDYLVETSYDDESRDFDGEASVAVAVAGEDVSDLLLATVNARTLRAR